MYKFILLLPLCILIYYFLKWIVNNRYHIAAYFIAMSNLGWRLNNRPIGRDFREIINNILQNRLDDSPYQLFVNDGEGRGVVMVAGGKYAKRAFQSVQKLRQNGCQLPVQIFYLGADELPELLLYDFENTEFHDIRVYCPEIKGWQAKAYAIARSKFAEVLFLDADNEPLQNPEPLFDLECYQSTGAVFWPDIFLIGHSSKVFWVNRYLFPKSVAKYLQMEHKLYQQESGQILIDKKRHVQPLLALLYLNAKSDVIYKYLFGDKDTFQIAWALCNHLSFMVQHPPYLGGTYIDGDFIPLSMLQKHPDNGTSMFMHYTLQKNLTSGIIPETTHIQLHANPNGDIPTPRNKVYNKSLFYYWVLQGEIVPYVSP
jgi:alpha 1,2-mannosyltransferase